MKKNFKSKMVTFICVLLSVLTLSSYVYAYANIQSGSCVIEPNVTTTICTVKKTDTSKYGTIFLKRSLPNISDFTIKVWMKDITNSTVLSDKYVINCTGTSTGHWIKFKTGVSFSTTDNILQNRSNKSS